MPVRWHGTYGFGPVFADVVRSGGWCAVSDNERKQARGRRPIVSFSGRAPGGLRRDARMSDPILREPLYTQPGHLLRRAQQISASVFHDEIGSQVTPMQYAVLCVLLDNPGVDQVSVAGLAAIDTSTAASVATRLEEKGLLSRRVDPANRRQRILTLTDQGRDLLLSLNDAIGRLHRRIFEKFSPREEARFMALLQKLVDVNNHQSRAPLTAARPRLAEDAVENPVADGV